MVNKHELNVDNTYTLNGLVKVLGYNRKTVEKYIANKNYLLTTLNFNNRDYEAYVVTPEELKKLAIEMANNIKTGKTVVATTYNKISTNDKNVSKLIKKDVYNDYTNEMLRNVKENQQEVYEVVQLRNEKENRLKQVHQLEVTNKDLEIKYSNSINMLELEKQNLENKVYLIEDKSKVLETNWAEQVQSNKLLQNKLDQKNMIIQVLIAVILIAVSVLSTIYCIK
jgi:hypothetical protein